VRVGGSVTGYGGVDAAHRRECRRRPHTVQTWRRAGLTRPSLAARATAGASIARRHRRGVSQLGDAAPADPAWLPRNVCHSAALSWWGSERSSRIRTCPSSSWSLGA
jgi:hypothetical protein